MHERLNATKTSPPALKKDSELFLPFSFWWSRCGRCWVAVRSGWWSVAVAATFLGCAYLFPAILSPLNIIWFKFAMLLYKVVNPLTMAMLFFTTVMPIGLIMRASGKDILNLKLDRDARAIGVNVIRQAQNPKR